MDGKKASNRGLVATIVALSVVLVAVIGLVVGIIIVQNNQPSEPEVVKTEDEIYYEITSEVYDMPAEEAIPYLNEQLEKYGETGIGTKIAIIKLNKCIIGEMFDEAVTVAEGLDIENISAMEKASIYNALMQLYGGLGDSQKVEYYMKELETLRESGKINGVGI